MRLKTRRVIKVAAADGIDVPRRPETAANVDHLRLSRQAGRRP